MLSGVGRISLAVVGAIITLAIPASAQLFTVSGTVTDPTLAPVANVDIFLYTDQGDPIGTLPIFTDGFGFYIIPDLPAGTYGVGFEPPSATGLLPYLDPVVVVAGNVTLNVTLAIGTRLSGYVRDTLGVGIFNIDLNVYDQLTGDKLDTPGDNTDLFGYYEVLIPTGTFRLRWRATGSEMLVPVEIENVVVNVDTTIDITMLPGHLVTGTVLDNLGQPVFDADLDFVDATTGLKITTPGDNTDPSGFYSAIIPAGLIDIDVEPLVADKLVAQEKLSVPITADTVIDFTLQPGFYVSGTVSSSGGAGVFNADIDVSYTTTGVKINTPGDNTDAFGFYQVVVPAGLFDIAYQPPVATLLAPVVVPGYMVTSDVVINVTVPDGVLLSGTVRNNSVQPVVNVDIDAEDATTGVHAELVGDHTDSTGYFAVVIVPGTYHIDIEPLLSRRLAAKQLLNQPVYTATDLQISLDTGMFVSGTVLDSLYSFAPNARVRAIILASGDTAFTPGNVTDSLGIYDIVVAPETYDLVFTTDSLQPTVDTLVLDGVSIGRDTTINVNFPAHGQLLSISGTVTNPSLAPVELVDISLYDDQGNPIGIPPIFTDVSGFYIITGLPAGIYGVGFEPPLTRHLAAKQVKNLSLTVNTDLSVALDTGMFVSGTVLDSSNAFAPHIWAWAISSSTGDTAFTPGNVTNSWGLYDIVVGPGTYDLLYAPDSLSPITDSVLYSDVAIGRDTIINVLFPGSPGGGDSCCIVPIRGNVDFDLGDNVDISDLVYLVDFMFTGGPPPPCLDEGNIDGVGGIDISDLVYLVDFMFTGGLPPAPCPL